jgi:hypothetical protein
MMQRNSLSRAFTMSVGVPTSIARTRVSLTRTRVTLAHPLVALARALATLTRARVR